MELIDLPPDLNELRKIIISSHLTTCFLILDELALRIIKETKVVDE